MLQTLSSYPPRQWYNYWASSTLTFRISAVRSKFMQIDFAIMTRRSLRRSVCTNGTLYLGFAKKNIEHCVRISENITTTTYVCASNTPRDDPLFVGNPVPRNIFNLPVTSKKSLVNITRAFILAQFRSTQRSLIPFNETSIHRHVRVSKFTFHSFSTDREPRSISGPPIFTTRASH